MSSRRFFLSTALFLAGCGDSSPVPASSPRLEAVTVSCTPTQVVAGQSAQCSASATDQEGAPFAVSAFTWTSSDSARAQVDASGGVRAQAAGPLTIRASATSGGITRQGEASLTVSDRPATVHAAPITASETWRLADSPHEVRGQLSVSTGATLTLEPGVVVRFAPDAELRVQGALLAPGSAQAPVQLLGVALTPGSWRGLVFSASGSASSLSHVSLRGCGAPSGEGACLSLRDSAAPLLQDVSVRQSGSVGVLADASSGFGPGSSRLSVSDSAGVAVRMSANLADSLPSSSSFSGNAADAAELSGNVTRSQAWSGSFLVPETLRVEGTLTTGITLTIAAGSVLRFAPRAEMLVGYDENLASLVVEGTAAAPVRFTADAASPQPGHWRGVYVASEMTTSSRLAHATFEYAGAEGALVGTRANLSIGGICETCVTLTDVTVQKSSGPGLVLYSSLNPESARLTSRDNGQYALSIAPRLVPLIAKDSTFSGNALGIELMAGHVNDSQTWPKLGLPYVITNFVYVGSQSPPTLTLAPGTEVRFAPGAFLSVGTRVGNFPGKLIAQGTAQAPIRFVPDAASPAPGYWRGLHFGRADGSRLEHVEISHGGGTGEPGIYRLYGAGNLNIYREIGPLLHPHPLHLGQGLRHHRQPGHP
ncbi:Ig-like domain-containing protein [Archangium primigenium]|uniref:Ig-like domain-containing protein n=1 Tax=[Archangium] primigenium TaxID=2792470 RepID=UPI00195AAE5C|nr:Ig-like domain-containing protein [Archangium primigenium]MBM7116146.1 Ig-like domain-containing protein [Archangium primigenium]